MKLLIEFFEIKLYVPFWADWITSVDLECMNWEDTLVCI